VGGGDKSESKLAQRGDFSHDSLNRYELYEESMSSRQRDLFQDDEADLFDQDRPAPVHRADPDKVRQELHKILAEARAAKTVPWDVEDTRVYRTIFPQMTNWLPADEAAQLRLEFEAELARLNA
jgi:tRNA nucleotidyltransferase/poly(A) polymerase